MTNNKQKIKENFSKSAKDYDQYADLQQEVLKNLFVSLKSNYQHILDIGAGTGTLIGMISKKFPAAKIEGIDIAKGMVEVAKSKIKEPNVLFQQGDGEALPSKSEHFDLVVSSLALQWMDPAKVFAEVARVLKPKGSFYFSTFGPATLGEIKRAGFSINDFPAKDKLEQMLSKHFSRVEVRQEVVVKNYQDVFELFFYLKQIGAQNPANIRNKGLMTKNKLKAMFFASKNGIDVSYEIYYGSCDKS